MSLFMGKSSLFCHPCQLGATAGQHIVALVSCVFCRTYLLTYYVCGREAISAAGIVAWPYDIVFVLPHSLVCNINHCLLREEYEA